MLQKLEDANLTFSGEKSTFGQPEILVIGHLCGSYGRKPSPSKVNVIQEMKEECVSDRGVKILGSMCILSHMDSTLCSCRGPLYGLLKKRRKFEWEDKRTHTVQKLKKLLLEAPALWEADYTDGTPIYVTVDMSPTGIGWVISQEDKDKNRYAIQFGAKVLTE